MDAVVIALKSRTIAPADAIAQSLEALAWLKANGCGQIYFKYCSTFDSTPEGNIGPVTEALMDKLGARIQHLPAPPFPKMAVPSAAAISSWATCFFLNPACAIIRSRR